MRALSAWWGGREASPRPITITIAHRSDGDYDFSVTSPSGGGTSAVVGINADGLFSFRTFNEAEVLLVGAALFNGLCSTSGAVVAGDGWVYLNGARLLIHVTDTTCDWGAGTGTQDLRPTVLTIGYQGEKP